MLQPVETYTAPDSVHPFGYSPRSRSRRNESGTYSSAGRTFADCLTKMLTSEISVETARLDDCASHSFH